MKPVKLNLLLIFSAWVLAAGCHQSPLLHHAQAGQNRPDTLFGVDPRTQEDKLQCPLFFKKALLCASLSWDQAPSTERDSTFVLRFWNKETGHSNGPYVNPSKTVGVKLWMPDMGHGSSPVKVDHAKDSANVEIPGVFKASNVYFVMGGEWEVHVQLKDAQKVVEEAVEKVSL